jgi:hypothetical protein
MDRPFRRAYANELRHRCESGLLTVRHIGASFQPGYCESASRVGDSLERFNAHRRAGDPGAGDAIDHDSFDRADILRVKRSRDRKRQQTEHALADFT